MGEKQQATLRLARQELEDLYLGVPDDSVDLTFKDLASSSSSLPAPPATTTSSSRLPVNAIAASSVGGDAHHDERSKPSPGALPRSSTNIFTYRPLPDHHQDAGGGGGGALLLQLTPSPPAAPARPPTAARFLHDHDEDDDGYGGDQYHYAGGRRTRRSHVAHDAAAAATAGGGHDRRAAAAAAHNYRRRPGIPHSNICALCNIYVYMFRHRCLVCGRVYCRRCVGAGMADMAEGRKCVDCLGRRYSHRYIHRAGDTTGGCGLCCFWGYYPNAKAVTAQELIWAEKGPAPRRRPRPPSGSSSYSDGGYYSSTNTVNNSASMSMAMNSDSSIAMMKMNGGGGMPASASSSFVASFPHNPHAFPL